MQCGCDPKLGCPPACDVKLGCTPPGGKIVPKGLSTLASWLVIR